MLLDTTLPSWFEYETMGLDDKRTNKVDTLYISTLVFIRYIQYLSTAFKVL